MTPNTNINPRTLLGSTVPLASIRHAETVKN
jgi:hypothetical protein